MKVLRFIFTVPFAMILLVLGILTGTLYSVRNACLEETVAQAFSEIQWSAIELPSEDGTGTVTLTEYVNVGLAPYGSPAMSEEEFDELIRFSAADQFLLSLVQDFRGWFFDGDPKPVIDVKALVEVVVKAAYGRLFGMEKTVINRPEENAESPFLSSTQKNKNDTSDLEELLGTLLPENASLSDLIALLPEDFNLSKLIEQLPEDLDRAPFAELIPEGVVVPEDASLSDLIALLPEDLELSDLIALLPEDLDLSAIIDVILENIDLSGLTEQLPEDVDLSGIFSEDLDLSQFTGFLEEMLIQELAAQFENDPSVTEGLRELERALDEAEPYRIAVSSLALYLLFGILAIVILIILAINRKGSTLGLPHIGLAAAFDGFIFFALSKTLDYLPADAFAELSIPERTLRVFASPLLCSFGETGLFCLAAGGTLFLLGIVLGNLRKKKRDIR